MSAFRPPVQCDDDRSGVRAARLELYPARSATQCFTGASAHLLRVKAGSADIDLQTEEIEQAIEALGKSRIDGSRTRARGHGGFVPDQCFRSELRTPCTSALVIWRPAVEAAERAADLLITRRECRGADVFIEATPPYPTGYRRECRQKKPSPVENRIEKHAGLGGLASTAAQLLEGGDAIDHLVVFAGEARC